jgi:DNA adenine methylase
MYIETQTFSGLTIEKAKFVDLKGVYKSKYEQFIDKLENSKYTNKIDNITNIENLSYADCIKKYDSKYTFFYCDPPYFKMEDYYTKEFGQNEHLKLSETLKSIKGKFALSYYDFPLLSKWFLKSKYNWQEKAFNRQNSSKKVGTAKGKEILILNY